MSLTTRTPHTAPRGFTLIELLVVIAIIGLLSSVVLTSLNSARTRGYDATRFSDLSQMKTVIDTYYTDNGAYPVATGQSGVWQSICGAPFNPVAQNNVVMSGGTSLVTSGYISAIPKGPLMNTSSLNDCYAYKSNGTDYKFMDYNPPNGISSNPSTKYLQDPNRPAQAWAVYSSGGSGF